MFKLKENYGVGRRILKCDHLRYSPAEVSTIITHKNLYIINIPREDSFFSMLNGYLDLNFEVFEKADNSRYANGNDIRLVNIGPFAFFSYFKLTTSSEKHLEDICCAHIVSLTYELLTSSRGSDDLFIGFDRDHNGRRDESTRNKILKVN